MSSWKYRLNCVLGAGLLLLQLRASAAEIKLRVSDSEGAVDLRGTLTKPAVPEKGIAIFISGAGETNRNGRKGPEGPLKDIAIRLSTEGFGTLLFDKRGVGASTGNFLTSTIEREATDVGSWIKFLKGTYRVTAAQISIVGHSEGGLVALLAASREPDLGRVILLNTPATAGREFILRQNVEAARARNAGQNEIDAGQSFLTNVLNLIAKYPDRRELRLNLVNLRFPIADTDENKPFDQEKLVELYTSPHYISLVQYHPETVIPNVRCPIFAMYSSLDGAVEPTSNAHAISLLLKHQPAASVKIIAGVDHFLAETPAENDKKRWLRNSVSPQVLNQISTWFN